MNTLEKLVLQTIGEDTDSPDVFTDDDTGLEPIRDSLNDAIQEISVLSGGHERVFHIPLVSGQMFYKLKIREGHFGWVTHARLVNKQVPLEQTEVRKLNKISRSWPLETGVPESFLQIGKNTLGFYRKPSGTTDTVEVNVVVIPQRYGTSADRIKLRDSFKWAAVHYAVSEYWASRGDAKEAMIWFNKYMQNANFQGVYPRADKTYELRSPTQENTAFFA